MMLMMKEGWWDLQLELMLEKGSRRISSVLRRPMRESLLAALVRGRTSEM
jgi:hypothetical protein